MHYTKWVGSQQQLLCYLVTEARKMRTPPTCRSETTLMLLVDGAPEVDDLSLTEVAAYMPSVTEDQLGLLSALEKIFLDPKNWGQYGFNGRGESMVRATAQFRGLQYRR